MHNFFVKKKLGCDDYSLSVFFVIKKMVNQRENVKVPVATHVKIWCGTDSNSDSFRDPRNVLTIPLETRSFFL